MPKRQLSEPVIGEATDEESRAIAVLEDAFEARYAEARVNMRWSAPQLETIRLAADLAGVPYQTYVKMVTFRQALSDLRDATVAGVRRAGMPSDAAG